MKTYALVAAGLLNGMMTMAANAAYPTSAVDSSHCVVMKDNHKPFLLVLRKGEKVQSAIEQCANDAELKGAKLVGLGAFYPVTLRYFDHVQKEYHDKVINQFMEVTNLTGNITINNGVRQNHIHVTLSDENFKPYAGHLKEASVGAVLEVLVTPLKYPVIKHHDDETGLDVITTTP